MRFGVSLIFCLLVVGVSAQEVEPSQLSLGVNTFDFGRVMEDGGYVKHRFEIANTGASDLSILNVRTTCGCTTPSWTRTPIPSGQKGFVEVEFDPTGRSGDFHKTIQIQSNAVNANMFVSISGTVVPALRKEELHHVFGGLAIKADQVNLGYLYKGATGTEYLTIRNTTNTEMKIGFAEVPGHIILDAFPAVLKPGEYGQIVVSYCTEKIDDWDVVIDQVQVLLNDMPVDDKKLSIIANIREDFRELTEEQKLAAPVALFSHDNVGLDTITSETPLACQFLIRNSGASDLKIRAVKASCGCTVATPEKTVLAPGDSTYIDAVFDPKGRSGNFKNGITVVTNDPVQYKKYLFLEGYIRPVSN